MGFFKKHKTVQIVFFIVSSCKIVKKDVSLRST